MDSSSDRNRVLFSKEATLAPDGTEGGRLAFFYTVAFRVVCHRARCEM